MRVIYKYTLQITEEQTVLLPEGHKLLTVQTQEGIGFNRVCLWVDVDPAAVEHPVKIFIYGTDNRTEEFKGKYLGTVQLNGFVWHVYIDA